MPPAQRVATPRGSAPWARRSRRAVPVPRACCRQSARPSPPPTNMRAAERSWPLEDTVREQRRLGDDAIRLRTADPNEGFREARGTGRADAGWRGARLPLRAPVLESRGQPPLERIAERT